MLTNILDFTDNGLQAELWGMLDSVQLHRMSCTESINLAWLLGTW